MKLADLQRMLPNQGSFRTVEDVDFATTAATSFSGTRTMCSSPTRYPALSLGAAASSVDDMGQHPQPTRDAEDLLIDPSLN